MCPTALQSTAAAVAIANAQQQCKASNYVVLRCMRLLHLGQRQRNATKFASTTSFNQSNVINSPFSSSLSHSSVESVSKFSTSSSAVFAKCLQLENINQNFIKLQYAVRGPLVIRAGEIEQEMAKGAKKPFKYVVRANIGDCHALGQQPITFLRQLLAICVKTELFDSPEFPEDVKERAKIILDSCSGKSIGSYSDSNGLLAIRQQAAKYIENRDGIPCNWEHIYLSAGATPSIKRCLAMINTTTNGKKPGVMVPIPQYPLYSATIDEYGMEKIGYYLDEKKNWSLEGAELQRAYDESKKYCEARAIVVINPGNPTGQVLKHENICEIIKFAYDKKLFILADEVYQYNIWDKDSKFFSFKKVLTEMGEPYKDMELGSVSSVSKGYTGECGLRGGLMELINLDPKVRAVLNKSLTATLCATTAGQIAISAVVNPPQPGEPSYEQFICEKNLVLNSLKERAELLYKMFNSIEGFKVNVVQGSMYLFPQIMIPPKAVEAAKAKGMLPDTFYAFELLESTGICVVPGNGFGQEAGTYHFRITILPQMELLKEVVEVFRKFHSQFLEKYK